MGTFFKRYFWILVLTSLSGLVVTGPMGFAEEAIQACSNEASHVQELENELKEMISKSVVQESPKGRVFGVQGFGEWFEKLSGFIGRSGLSLVTGRSGKESFEKIESELAQVVTSETLPVDSGLKTQFEEALKTEKTEEAKGILGRIRSHFASAHAGIYKVVERVGKEVENASFAEAGRESLAYAHLMEVLLPQTERNLLEMEQEFAKKSLEALTKYCQTDLKEIGASIVGSVLFKKSRDEEPKNLPVPAFRGPSSVSASSSASSGMVAERRAGRPLALPDVLAPEAPKGAGETGSPAATDLGVQ